MECCVFIPRQLEAGRSSARDLQPDDSAINGNYDDVNRLCTQWRIAMLGIVNINLRSYNAEARRRSASRS